KTFCFVSIPHVLWCQSRCRNLRNMRPHCSWDWLSWLAGVHGVWPSQRYKRLTSTLEGDVLWHANPVDSCHREPSHLGRHTAISKVLVALARCSAASFHCCSPQACLPMGGPPTVLIVRRKIPLEGSILLPARWKSSWCCTRRWTGRFRTQWIMASRA